MERANAITVKGNGVTLIGPELKEGDKAPDFTILNKTLQPVSLSDLKGEVKILSVTPSLDTPVCDAQARRFNEEATKLGSNVNVVNISVDLPFAIGRFCTTAGIDNIETFSDHRDVSFGEAYGVLIKELRLLARAIFILDGSNTVRYVEIVPEMTDSPDFEKALSAARGLTQASASA